jgi:acyl-CoA thioesterase FadM
VLNVRCSRHMCSGNGWPIRCTPAVDAPPPIAHANGKGQMTALPVGQDATGTRQLAAWRERVMPPVEELAGDLWSIPVPIPDNPLRYVLCYAFGAAGGLEAPLLSRCVNAATLLHYYVPEVVHYRNRIHLPGWDTIVAMMISAALRFSDLDMFGHVNHARLIGFCEEHRTAMFDLLDGTRRKQWLDGGFVVARVEANFAVPVGRLVRAVDVVGVLSIGTSSFRMCYTIRAGHEIAAEITEVLVAVESGKPPPLIEPEREWLAAMSAHE